jgi:hypothetical protein
LGNQDTFYGHMVRIYLQECYLEGTVDFIYGESTMWFEKCQLYAKGSCITAANTEPFAPFGMVFNNCSITGTKAKGTLLGRSWGPYASTTFLNTSMSDVIAPEGWSDMGSAASQATARYREYNNTGTGSSTAGRVSWSKVLSSSEASKFTLLNVMKNTYASSPTTDNWNPLQVISLYPDSTVPQDTSTYFKVTKKAMPGGSITQNPAGDSIKEGTAVQFQAIPLYGWALDKWSGSYNGTGTSFVSTPMNGDFSITASFLPLDIFTYQAESSVLQDAILETKNTGYSGTGYINISATANASIDIPVYSEMGGPEIINITYSNGSGSTRYMSVAVNGVQQIGSASYESTSNWSTWSTLKILLTLTQGVNVIKLATINSLDGPNIDKLVIEESTTRTKPRISIPKAPGAQFYDISGRIKLNPSMNTRSETGH